VAPWLLARLPLAAQACSPPSLIPDLSAGFLLAFLYGKAFLL